MINKDYLVFFGLQSVRELVKNALVVYNVEIPVEREDYRVRLEKSGEIGLVAFRWKNHNSCRLLRQSYNIATCRKSDLAVVVFQWHGDQRRACENGSKRKVNRNMM